MVYPPDQLVWFCHVLSDPSPPSANPVFHPPPSPVRLSSLPLFRGVHQLRVTGKICPQRGLRPKTNMAGIEGLGCTC
eukprot:2089529-Pyramimonas_sp.AAC.1